MIDLDDYKAEHKAALDAANEYARRARKGLPSDRWTDGQFGDILVAEGIQAMNEILQSTQDVLGAVWADLQATRQASTDAMHPHIDPMRDNRNNQ